MTAVDARESNPGWEVNHIVSGKHGLIMLLCCLVPLAAFFLVSMFNVSLSSLGTIALVLMCPLMHLLLMRGMSHQHGSQGEPSRHDAKPEPRALPTKET